MEGVVCTQEQLSFEEAAETCTESQIIVKRDLTWMAMTINA